MPFGCRGWARAQAEWFAVVSALTLLTDNPDILEEHKVRLGTETIRWIAVLGEEIGRERDELLGRKNPCDEDDEDDEDDEY